MVICPEILDEPIEEFQLSILFEVRLSLLARIAR